MLSVFKMVVHILNENIILLISSQEVKNVQLNFVNRCFKSICELIILEKFLGGKN